MRRPSLRIERYKHSSTSRFVIEGLRVNGKRVRKFFKSKVEAETYLQQKRVQIDNEGIKALQMHDSLRIEAVNCHERLKAFGKTLTDATDFYIEYLQQVERTCILKEGVEFFLQAKEKDGKSVRYLQDLRTRLAHFSQAFGSEKVAAIRTLEIDNWLRELDLSPQSRNNYRTVLNAFFNYMVNRGYCATNPVLKTAKAEVVDKPPEIFTVEELYKLLDVSSDEVVPYIAIGAFAGLRPAEIQRLDWKEIKLERGYIEVSAHKSKTASRRLVKIQPNLQSWLQPFAKAQGRVTPLNLRNKLEATWKAADMKRWPANALRHSFASYHLAHFNDAAKTALELGHADTSMLYAHYRELVTPEDAKRYWDIERLKKEVE